VTWHLVSISTCINCDISAEQIVNGFDWAVENEIDIISNSWEIPNIPSTPIEEAISNALNNGRNGKGCVVVFPAGNDYYESVRYPANIITDILTVGAISFDGKRAIFSNYGGLLDVVTPGDMVTTDEQGENGSGPDDYILLFMALLLLVLLLLVYRL